MNPITKALDEIRFSIPQAILNEAFISQELLNTVPGVISLDTRIREQIIDPRVLIDLDLHGGTEAYIPLEQPVRAETPDPYTVIYHIPNEVVQNRPIVQVYSVHFAALGYQNAGMALHYTESPLASETRRVLDSAMRVPPAMTSYLNLIAHNTVMARFVYLPYTTAFMRVRLGNDNALSHIRAPAIPEFAKLCVLATKAYIYNKMIVPMDQGQLSGGQMLGVFRETIMNYADADQMYHDGLRRWRKISVLNDSEARRRHIRTIVGSP
jgi:hypothetical protein